MPPARPETIIGFLLNDVSRLLRRDMNRRAQPLGLTQAQWRALAYLSRCEGMNQATLADLLDVAPISLARLIDRMEAAGWIERRPDPNDRRAVRLFLAPKAQPVLDQLWDMAALVRADALEGVSRADRQALVRILQRMKENMLASEGRDPADGKLAQMVES